MKGESNLVFPISRVKANKFISKLKILLLEIIKAEIFLSFGVRIRAKLMVFIGKKNAGRQTGMLYVREMEEEGKEEGECESEREKCSLRELTEWEWHKGAGGRSK